MFSWQTKKNMARAFLLKDRPFYVQYYILSKCNLNCRMCNIVEGNSDLEVASPETVSKVAKNLRKIGAGVVLLTGGEPFLHPRLPEIIKAFVDEGLNPRLQTAGFHTTREQLEACREAGAREINISLDSLIPAKQDYINGSIPNSWRRAIETIVAANDVFDDPDRVCALGTVLSRFNYMEVPAIAELATFLGWWQSMVPVHITSLDAPMNFRGVEERFKFNFPEDKPLLDALRQQLHQMKRDGFKIFDSDAYLDSCFYFLEHGSPNWRKDGVCDSPNLYFAILPNGDFAVCCDHRFQGRVSVADAGFPEVYRSREFNEAVKTKARACSGCNFGSYPEVTLSVRDWPAFASRVGTVLFSQRASVPKRTVQETFEFIDHLRGKYSIPDYEGPAFTVKPKALSQRYGDPELLGRGARKVPRKYLPTAEGVGGRTSE